MNQGKGSVEVIRLYAGLPCFILATALYRVRLRTCLFDFIETQLPRARDYSRVRYDD